MKKVNGTPEARLASILASYTALLHDVTQMGDKAGPMLTRAIASANHMLNVALAMAAAGGLTKETVEKALDLGEQTATELVEQAMAMAHGRGVG